MHSRLETIRARIAADFPTDLGEVQVIDDPDWGWSLTYAGQVYGGYYADQGPATFEYGVLNSETRITAYIGLGTHSMPGDVWWRTWRTLPADFTWQGQVPQGYNATYADPQSGKQFTLFFSRLRRARCSRRPST